MEIGKVANTNNKQQWNENDGQQFLTFQLNDEEYGVNILQVNAIRKWTPITTLPNIPSFIKGVLDLRGEIVPIIDLRLRFSIEAVEYGPTTVVILLNVNHDGNQVVMGIVVDAVSDTHSVNTADIRPSPTVGGIIDVNYLQGLVEIDDKLVLLLNVDKLLTSKQISQVINTEETA
ncbi:MAG: purine-binding chemotaxis protein CheW [Psychrobium sp.]|nr:purine-binding chemotaxis protein CheW [Psychrobium sp.]